MASVPAPAVGFCALARPEIQAANRVRGGVMRLYGAVAVRGFRRYATYRVATLAGVFTNTVFGFIMTYTYIALWTVRPRLGGYDVPQVVTYAWLGQALLMTTALMGGGFEADLGEPEVVLPGTETRRALARHLSLALASDAIGGSHAVIDLTVAYLKERQQFGKVIGTFQALQHRSASLYVIIKCSHALLYEACQASAARRAIAALSAKSYAAETALTTVKECVALHGAMGYTAEHNMSLYFRRAMALAVAGGDAVTCRKRLHAERQLLQDI